MSAGTKLSIVMADDEPIARRRIRRMLSTLASVELVAEADDGPSALQAIESFRPDVVLLDVRMPGFDGMAVARALRTSDAASGRPAVVFVTAHSEFALDAFEVEAADFLLKPVDVEGLTRALDRVRGRLDRADRAEYAESITNALRLGLADGSFEAMVPRVTARRGNSVYYFDAREIDFFEARDRYVRFTHRGSSYSTDETLSSLMERLESLGFLQIHRRTLVRLGAVLAVHSGVSGGVTVELAEGLRLPVSRRRLPSLRQALAAS
ncbi:MAG: LytTR family DNA-binding domain-containing protein [Thermoanaerobaculia bacterium]|nr:LytTR family DNA-binding domain-containing protein [Thermoanaerobaculia bacterium]